MSQVDLRRTIQAKHIMAPIVNEGCITMGTPAAEAMRHLELNSFDYRLVRDAGRIVGFVARTDLRGSSDPLQLGHQVRSLTVGFLVSDATPIRSLLASLVDFPFHAVISGRDIAGVVHTSDLNKHPVYAYFYFQLSLLEQQLMSLIREQLPSSDLWKPLISQDRWNSAEKRWKEARQLDVEIDPLYYLDFSDYLSIVAGDQALWGDLSFKSKTKFNDFVGSIAGFRNDIMHPVRDLIGQHRSVSKLCEIENKIQDLLKRIPRKVQTPTDGA